MTIANSSVETLNQIPEMLREGITSFKIYTTYNGLKLNYKEIKQVMNAISAYGGLCMVHAEDDETIRAATGKLLEDGNISPQWFPFSRPASAEIEAVRQCIEIARESKVITYMWSIYPLLNRLKQYPVPDKIKSPSWQRHVHNIFYWINPIWLKQVQLMLQGLFAHHHCVIQMRSTGFGMQSRQGMIQTIGSDHCSFRLHPLKEIGLNDFRLVPGGLPGIELRYPLIHTFGVLNNHLCLQDWVNLCSTQPAKIFGLYPRKGSLAIGSDADIVLFNPVKKVIINQKMLHENVDYSPYNNLELTGYPDKTVVKGKIFNFRR